MNSIFNEVPNCVSKNSVLCSLHFTTDSFTNKAQFACSIFRKTETKDDAVLTILDLTVMSHHTSVSNYFYYVITIALSVITDR